jgi:hypothetical protein
MVLQYHQLQQGGSHQVFCRFCKSLHICHLTTSKDLTIKGFCKQSSLGGLDVGNTHCSNSFQGRNVKKTFMIPYLIGKKRRMASVLVISNSTDQEKVIVVNLECELCTTSAGGTA